MILVTGGTGLLGMHLLHQLAKSNDKVRATFRNKHKLSLVKKIFKYYSPAEHQSLYKKIEWVQCDVLDVVALDDAMQDVNKVFHCAAVVSFNPAHKKELKKVNIEGTANVVDACLRAGIDKLCHVSSTSALGTLENTEITEKTPWETNTNPSNYSVSKYLGEREVWRGIEEGLNAVIVNPSMIVGPGDWNMSSAALIKRVYDGLVFYTKGSTGFVDVRDVVKCMIGLMESDIHSERFLVVGENLPFKIFMDHIAENLNKAKSSIAATTILTQLAWRLEWVRSYFTKKEPVITKESARIAQKKELYSNRKIKETLGIEFTPINDAIKNTVELFLQEHHLKVNH
ncbi:MAG TPA: NAD-dependent epimerase [Flavobacteriales bacterium]|nr:NAD-dependent epimerase [Flavobacteriales bacterium]|tara:strand:- start:21208 stop:22233 length:1026 start_codon:yes stop_codon:yes gene_type:complete